MNICVLLLPKTETPKYSVALKKKKSNQLKTFSHTKPFVTVLRLLFKSNCSFSYLGQLQSHMSTAEKTELLS